MAVVERYFAYITFADCRKNPSGGGNKTSSIRVRVSAANANTYFAANTDALRAATEVGLLMTAFAGLSSGYRLSWGVSIDLEQDAPNFPATESAIYTFDKYQISYRAGLDNYVVSIPARDDIDANVASDGVSVLLVAPGATGEVTNLVTRFESTVQSKNGDAVTVNGIRVSS